MTFKITYNLETYALNIDTTAPSLVEWYDSYYFIIYSSIVEFLHGVDNINTNIDKHFVIYSELKESAIIFSKIAFVNEYDEPYFLEDLDILEFIFSKNIVNVS